MSLDQEQPGQDVLPGVRALIEALVADHSWLLDHGQSNQIASLYTPDGRILGLGDEIVGEAAINAWGARRAAMLERTSRHVCTNVRLRPGQDGRLRGTVVLTLYRHDGAARGPASPLLIGDYEDIYACCRDGRWRFAQRAFTVLFGGG